MLGGVWIAGADEDRRVGDGDASVETGNGEAVELGEVKVEDDEVGLVVVNRPEKIKRDRSA